jgi:shikimate dehydrogenase
VRRLFAVLGDPVAHSRSPAIHARAFALLGVDAVYAPLQVTAEDLPVAVQGLRAIGMAGFNVTVPHKVNIAALCDRRSPAAELIGAVNCVVREEAEYVASQPLGQQRKTVARLVGHNTDGAGLLLALRMRGVAVEGVRAVVLGAGGAARAAAFALAGKAAEVNIVNRDPAKARVLSLQLRAGGVKSRATALGAAELPALLGEMDLVVQCSTVGMNSDQSIVDAAMLGSNCAVCDLVYAGPPHWPLGDTALLAAARARGMKTVDGLDVLVHQAIASRQILLATTRLESLIVVLRAAAIDAGTNAGSHLT